MPRERADHLRANALSNPFVLRLGSCGLITLQHSCRARFGDLARDGTTDWQYSQCVSKVHRHYSPPLGHAGFWVELSRCAALLCLHGNHTCTLTNTGLVCYNILKINWF